MRKNYFTQEIILYNGFQISEIYSDMLYFSRTKHAYGLNWDKILLETLEYRTISKSMSNKH